MQTGVCGLYGALVACGLIVPAEWGRMDGAGWIGRRKSKAKVEVEGFEIGKRKPATWAGSLSLTSYTSARAFLSSLCLYASVCNLILRLSNSS